ncbi:monofunctional biosynthetic peptidoglycan transglycosylase [Klebsiella oxytoca]|nr:monofunctional biosynthetic peptidoglycan transglycosylase [Klebsiella oxytoca]
MTLRFSPLRMMKRFVLRLLLACVVLWGGGIALFSIVPVPFSAVMLERQVSAWLSGNFHYVAHSDWVGMDEISPWMGLAVIAAEDQKFPEHWGLMFRPLRRRWRITSAMTAGSAERQRCRSKRQKTCSCGMAAAG